jgi:hypothetical protein
MAAKGRVAAIACQRGGAALGGVCRAPHQGIGSAPMNDDELAALQDRARKHPLRLKILALAMRRDQSLELSALRRELPDHPPVEVIDYHLLVLRQVDLLPPVDADPKGLQRG